MKKFFHRDVLFSTIFVFVFMFLLKFVLVNTHFLDPIHNALKDFEINDIVFSKLKKTTAQQKDPNVILVNIGHLNREEIAKQINIINRHQPAVLAIDVTFETLKDPAIDSLLADAINDAGNPILAGYFDYPENAHGHDKDNGGHIGFTDFVQSNPFFLQKATTGFTNFIAGHKEKTIRHFIKQESWHDTNYTSFPVLAINSYNPEVYKSFISRRKKVEIINYKGNMDHYIVFDVDDIVPGNRLLSIIKDKIVLMGFLGPDINTKVFEDIHFTPMNPEYSGKSFPDTYGVVIHANIISMILNGKFISSMSLWIVYAISFILCYLHMYFFIRYFIHRHVWYHLFAKVVQLLSSIIIVGISVWLFAKHNYQIKTTLIILPIILSIDLLYIYDGLVKTLNRLYGYKTIFLTKHK